MRRSATLIVVAVGWLVVMNGLQPRLMATSLRIHPIVVLGSVLVGGKIAGIRGAIFGIPIAAVLSALFLHSIGRNVEGSPVAARAAERARAARGPRRARAARAEPGHGSRRRGRGRREDRRRLARRSRLTARASGVEADRALPFR